MRTIQFLADLSSEIHLKFTINLPLIIFDHTRTSNFRDMNYWWSKSSWNRSFLSSLPYRFWFSENESYICICFTVSSSVLLRNYDVDLICITRLDQILHEFAFEIIPLRDLHDDSLICHFVFFWIWIVNLSKIICIERSTIILPHFVNRSFVRSGFWCIWLSFV